LDTRDKAIPVLAGQGSAEGGTIHSRLRADGVRATYWTSGWMLRWN